MAPLDAMTIRLHLRGTRVLEVVEDLPEALVVASIALASNHPFSEWGRTFSDGRLAAAVVDRLTFRAHIFETGTDSYRLRASRAARKGARRRHELTVWHPDN